MRGDYMLSAVSAAVNAEFAGELECFVEVPVQGCLPEYLFVAQLQSEQAPSGLRRFQRYYFFDVRYHVDDKKGSQNRRKTQIAERLKECLQIIATDDTPVRASSIRSETVDGVLHVFADYPVRVLQLAPDPPDMQTLQTNQNIKKE